MKRGEKLKVGALGWALLLTTMGLTAPCHYGARQPSARLGPEPRSGTDWRVSPSFKFDALCFLNVLTGDPFYLRYYEKEYSEFAPRLTPKARAALNELKRKLKDENGNIISAFLCMYFSATDDATLDDMLRTLGDGGRLKRSLRQTVYFNERGWRLYQSVRGDLKAVLAWLKEAGFADYWDRNVLPKIRRTVATFEKDLALYDVVAEVERHLGFSLGSNTVTVYLLYFARPHGIRVTGTRFIADISYPLPVVLQNAVHEMMHPPYNLSGDQELTKALAALKADAFLMEKVLNHNPSFGYNSFEGFVEEDCVRALEQVVTEKLKIAREARRRWKDEDDGIHVFAVALYSLMRQEQFNRRAETFRDFLMRMLNSGKLSAGRIKPLYDAFYS